MITIAIHVDTQEALWETFESISKQMESMPDIKVIIIRDKESFIDEELLLKWKDSLNVVKVIEADKNIGKTYNRILNLVDTKYLQIIPSGTTYRGKTIAVAMEYFVQNDEVINVVKIPCYKGKEVNYTGPWTRVADLCLTPELVPTRFADCICRVETVRENGFDETISFEDIMQINAMAKLFLYNKKIGIVKATGINYPSDLIDDYSYYANSQEKDWYLSIVKQCIIPLLEKTTDNSEKKPPIYIQYMALYLVKVMFMHNNAGKNKHVFDKDFEEFKEQIKRILSYVEDDVIKSKYSIGRFKIKNDLMLYLLHIKNEEEMTGSDFSHKFCIDLMEENEDGIIIEARILNYTFGKDVKISVELNGNQIPIVETTRYSQNAYFGQCANSWFTMLVKIPEEELDGRTLVFQVYFVKHGQRELLTMTTSRWPSKVFTKYGTAYCILKGYMVRVGKNRIRLQKKTAKSHLKAELKYLKTMLKCRKKAFVLRVIYWLTRPYFSRKRIWITYDKLYKAGDCGEYFFKYAAAQKDGIEVRYLVNKEYPDAARLKEEGCHPIYIKTLKQYLYFLNAEVIATTHANIPIFSGLGAEVFDYFKDLFHADVVCIQHGLAVQYMPNNLNRVYDNLKAFYLASPMERDNLGKDIYGYYDKSMFKMTGIPRFDGLQNRDQKQILIIPTWRSYLAMPPKTGEARAYAPHFKETEYFHIYNNLINDKMLIKCAKEHGYKIKYVLHPTICAQSEDFTISSDSVEVLSPLDINYEQILTESSLMVTDYSGVQFDFAYMRKPIVYYHTPKLPPHYEEGGFCYETSAFGEICETHDEMIKTLCDYMERACQMNSFYEERVNEFFVYSDLNSCKRIYEDLLAMENRKEDY